MPSNAYFLAKFRFDTAENEPAKNLQNFRKMHLPAALRDLRRDDTAKSGRGITVWVVFGPKKNDGARV